MTSQYSTFTTYYIDKDGQERKKRNYSAYDGSRKQKDRHDTALRLCECGANVPANKLPNHKRNDRAHLAWKERKEAADQIESQAREGRRQEELKLKTRVVIETCVPFFYTGSSDVVSWDRVPSVLERVKQDRERLNERVAQLGKAAEWNDWLVEQDNVIVTRHQDPTRGPSLMEFKQYVQQQQLIRKRDEETIRQLRAQPGVVEVQTRTAIVEDDDKEVPTFIAHTVEPTESLQQSAPLRETVLQEQPVLLSPAEEEDIARLMNVVNVQQPQQQQEQSQKQRQASTSTKSVKPNTTKKRKSSKVPPTLDEDDIHRMITWAKQEYINQRSAHNSKSQVSFETFARDIRERYTEWHHWYHRPETQHTACPYDDYRRWFEDLKDDVAEPKEVFGIWFKVAGIQPENRPTRKARKVD
jgi:hypothetical protein